MLMLMMRWFVLTEQFSLHADVDDVVVCPDGAVWLHVDVDDVVVCPDGAVWLHVDVDVDDVVVCPDGAVWLHVDVGDVVMLMLMMWWFVLTEQFGCMLTDRGELPDAGHPFHLQRVPGGHDILADLQHHGRPVLLG